MDAVITGEGETAIIQAAQLTAKGEPLPKILHGCPFEGFTAPGIHYRPGEALGNLLYYESSRGCPFSCAFCLSGREEKSGGSTPSVRAKSAEATLTDLAAFEQFTAPITVKLVDRTFNFDRERAKAIWRGLLSDSFTKCYHFEIAAHLLDEESFSILARFPAGKIRLEIGLQSTNPHTLAAISRHTDAEQVLAAAKRLTEESSCHVHLDLIAGLPHEDFASFARSFDRAYSCCHVLQLGFLKLLHGTALRENTASFGAVAEGNAPYTILRTNCLSMEEIETLHAISDLCERLRDSGRFTRTLRLLLPEIFTPFAFFSAFSAYLTQKTGRELQKIAQRDLFTHLADFVGANTPVQTHWAVREALRADFAASEVRKPPHHL